MDSANQSNPFSTGGGGNHFELLVATTYLVDLLALGIPRGLKEIVQHVKFQTRYAGNYLDDIEVTSYSGAKLHLQVKHKLTFSKGNDLYKSVIMDCWRDFSNANFNRNEDRVGIGLGIYPMTVQQDFQNLLRAAKTSYSYEEFIKKLLTEEHCSEKVRDYYTDLKEIIKEKNDRQIDESELWAFLRCLEVLCFDLENEGSRDTVMAWNTLLNVVRYRDVGEANNLFTTLYFLASEYAKSAGTIGLDTIMNTVPSSVNLNDPSIVIKEKRFLKEQAVIQVFNQLTKQKNSKKYIPDIFVEINDIKEKARYFTDPVLFWKKVIRDCKKLSFVHLNYFLNRLGQAPFDFTLPAKFIENIELGEIKDKTKELQEWLEQKNIELKEYESSDFQKSFPDENEYEIKYQYQSTFSFQRKISDIIKLLKVLGSEVLIITERAGQGKTNFVCDLAENILLRKSIPALFLTGVEFNSMESSIEDFILKKATNGRKQGTLLEYLEELRQICVSENCTFIIIIDAINEHRNISQFSQTIENFIEFLTQYNFIRVVITCRTEYFEERFRNLRTASFSKSCYYIEGLNHEMEVAEKTRLFEGYLRFFNISILHYSPIVYETLVNDTFLLRIFCEAYGDPQSCAPIKIAELYDIYKESLFKRYFDTKCSEIKNKKYSELEQHAFQQNDLIQLLKDIIKYMIDNHIFNDVPLPAIIDNDNKVELSRIIDEDILLRKDLKDSGEIFAIDKEVINFTFDEFRDYLLAQYLLNEVFTYNPNGFATVLNRMVKPETPVAEGISKYVFLISKRKQNSGLDELLKKNTWYLDLFLPYIFDTEDTFINNDDVTRIRHAFKEKVSNSAIISTFLMRRYDVKTFININITHLFEVIVQLDEKEFNELVNPVFKIGDKFYFRHEHYEHRRWPIDKLLDNLEAILNKTELPQRPYLHLIFELLILLSPVTYDYSPYYRIVDLYEKYIDYYPENAVEQLIKYTSTKNEVVNQKVWFLLKYCNDKKIKLPKEIKKELLKRFRSYSRNSNFIFNFKWDDDNNV